MEMLYANQAKDFEVKGRLKEAERLYTLVTKQSNHLSASL